MLFTELGTFNVEYYKNVYDGNLEYALNKHVGQTFRNSCGT